MKPTAARALDVPGARLLYDVRGSGPPLLLIPGGWGDAGMFTAIAPILSKDHTVVTYDPRGLGRSTLTSTARDITVDVQADDARRVLAAVTREPARVLGISGGAMTGLALISRHPEQVSTLVAHEPPVVELLPDHDRHRSWAQEVCGVYQSDGPDAAMRAFLAGAGLDDGPGKETADSPDAEMLEEFDRMTGNLDVFFAHMYRQLSDYLPDAAALRPAADRLVIAASTRSAGQLAHRAAVALAGHLGVSVVDFPGDHGSFMSKPDAFAEALRRVLTGQG